MYIYVPSVHTPYNLLIVHYLPFLSLYHPAGAMRIPGGIGDEPKHYLTDFYGLTCFKIPPQNFINKIKKGYYFFGGEKYSVEGMPC